MNTNLPNIPEFRSPAWCLNGHWHTISRSFTGQTNQPDVQRIEIPTPDNDFLEIDYAADSQSNAVIVLFHGLEGSSDRYYIVELMKELLDRNFSVAAVNFRSCGSRMNDRPRFYHSGATDDYATVFEWIRRHHPKQKVGAVGFSLGANALIKSLGEEQSSHPADAAVAVSTPYDLYRGSTLLSKGFNKVYQHYFLRTLRKKLALKRQSFPGLPKFEGSSLFAFDDQVTGPIHGFNGAKDYYRRCSSNQFIPVVKKPTLLIHSREDPLCPVDAMPMKNITDNPHTDYIITERGGHVGFWSKPAGWLNTIIANYLSDKLLV